MKFVNNQNKNQSFELCILSVFLAFGISLPQSNTPLNGLLSTDKAAFKKLEQHAFNKTLKDSGSFYPLSNGDFWEYTATDTTTFMGYEGLKYSVIKEVIGDTLMPNVKVYKIVKWTKCANSVNEPPKFEYLRKDSSNKIYTYWENQDHLLYDITLSEGSIYPSQYLGYSWLVSNKYTVTGFGDTLDAIDFQLIDQSSNTKRTKTVIENFGLTYFSGDINGYSNVPEGNFYGAIINDSTYGYLLARKQKIDWSEFYPLHIGDYWKYEEYSGFIKTIYTKKILKDTLMPDGNIYKKYEYETHGGPYPAKGVSYERLDNNGIVWGLETYNTGTNRKHKFIICLGDTVSLMAPGSCYRLNDKSYGSLYYFMYPDVTFSGLDFSQGLGLTQITSEGGGRYLVGAIINGQIYGDTTITSIDDESKDNPTSLILYQNYPNPFNPTTKIKYSISKDSYVYLTVYDMLGQEIKRLLEEQKPAGEYEVSFNASFCSSGIYIYTLNANGYSKSRKLIVIK